MDTRALVGKVQLDAYQMLLEIEQRRVKRNEVHTTRHTHHRSAYHNRVLHEMCNGRETLH